MERHRGNKIMKSRREREKDRGRDNRETHEVMK
jgi:hypothetical protein